jgi:hypothetical protein
MAMVVAEPTSLHKDSAEVRQKLLDDHQSAGSQIPAFGE